MGATKHISPVPTNGEIQKFIVGAKPQLPVMPALVAGIHVFLWWLEDVDGRIKSGHDERQPLRGGAAPDNLRLLSQELNVGREAIMKTRFVVALAAALALMISVPTGAHALKRIETCGGLLGQMCGEGMLCQFKPGTCGRFDMTGVCVKIPHFCPRITGPTIEVCGCNGQTYINDCERQKAMVSLAHKGKCR